MIRSSLSDYRNAYIPFKGTVTVPNAAAGVALNNINKRNI